MCLGDREAPFVQGEAGKGNGRTMGEHGLVWGEKQPGAGSSQELPTLTHTQTHRLPCLFTKHPPASSPPSPALLSHAGCPEPPTSHLPGRVPTFPRTPRTHRSHLRRSQEKKKKKKALGSPQHCLDPSSMPLFHRHHLPLRSACKRASISSPSSRLGPRSRGNLCLLGLAFPLRCALLYLLGSAHKHQLCITGDE